MKLIVMVLGIGLLAGCTAKTQAPDPRIAELEGRVAQLESRLQETREQQTNIVAALELVIVYSTNQISRLLEVVDVSTNVSGLDATTGLPIGASGIPRLDPQNGLPMLTEGKLFDLDCRVGSLEFKFTNLVSSINGRHIARPASSPVAVPGQMPADVVAGIRAKAENDWPDNYEMQAYEIKQQTEAWYQLNR